MSGFILTRRTTCALVAGMRAATVGLFILAGPLLLGCGRVAKESPDAHADGPPVAGRGGQGGAAGSGGAGGTGGGGVGGGGTGGTGGSVGGTGGSVGGTGGVGGGAAGDPGPDASGTGGAGNIDTRPPDTTPVIDMAPPVDLPVDRLPDLPPDQPPSPCPGGPPPPGYGLFCGCDGAGTIQCSGSCSRPDDTCVPTGQYYFLTNTFLGDNRRLDTYAGGTSAAYMATMTGYSGQFWVVTALGDGTYRLTNMFLGATRSLEPSADGSQLIMGNTANVPAQKWRIRAVKADQFRLTSAAAQGTGRSLDTRNDTMNDPFLAPIGDFSGQYWKLTKAPP